MKKTLVAAAAAAGLLGAVAGVSVWSGRAVTQRLQLQTTRFGKLLPGFKLLDEQIDRGLFSTTRTLRVQLGCMPADPAKAFSDPPRAPEPLELRIRDHVKHGPFPGGAGLLLASVDTQLLPSARLQGKLDRVLAGQPLLHAHTKIDFGGNLLSEVKLPAIKLDDAHGQFETSPSVAEIEVRSAASDATKYSVVVPKATLRASGRGETLAFELGTFRGEGELHPQDALSLWLSPGKMRGTLAYLAMSGSGGDPNSPAGKPRSARFEGLECDADSSIDKGLWSNTTRMQGKGKFDQYTVDKIELRASIKRVHAASYDKLLSSMFGTALDCDPAAQQAAFAALFPDLRKQLAEVLVHDPEYALDSFAIELDGKRAELSYTAGTRGVRAPDLDGDLFELLMKKGVLRASAKVHFELLVDLMVQAGDSMPAGAGAVGLRPGEREQAMVFATGMLDPLIQSGYVVRDGDFISAAAAVEAGQLLLNGKPMALPNLAPSVAAP
jgi:hypothetical protein